MSAVACIIRKRQEHPQHMHERQSTKRFRSNASDGGGVGTFTLPYFQPFPPAVQRRSGFLKRKTPYGGKGVGGGFAESRPEKKARSELTPRSLPHKKRELPKIYTAEDMRLALEAQKQELRREFNQYLLLKDEHVLCSYIG